MLERALASDSGSPDDATIERILDAAFEQFLSFGLRRTTVDDVARAAGVGRMTLYRRFPRKEALVRATLQRELSRFLVDLDVAVMQGATPAERLVEGFVFGMHRAREHPLFTRLLETEPETLLPYLTLEAGPMVAAASAFIAARTSADGAPDADVQRAAETLVRLSHSLLLTPETALPFENDDEAREFAHQIVGALL